MIDFPASPTTGQIFTAAGASWRYDGTKWVAYGVGSSNDVGRNTIQNPYFNIQQHGTGPWTGASNFMADRWKLNLNLDTISCSIVTALDTDRTQIGDEAALYDLQAVVTGNAGAAAYSFITQSIENLRRLSGKTVTISFWAKVSAGTPKIGINAQLYTGTGGSPTPGPWALTTGASVTVTGSWARYSTVIAVPSIAGMTLGTNNDHSLVLAFWLSCGATNNAVAGNIGVQSATFQFWGIQLEVGSTATPLEKIDPGEDLKRCQRFYQIGIAWAQYSNCTAGTLVGNTYPFPVTMRATPTAVATNNGSAGIGTPTLNSLGPSMVAIYGTVSASGGVNINVSFAASADL